MGVRVVDHSHEDDAPWGLDLQTDGFAAVDALLALMILSITLIFSLAAAHTARRAADSAARTREADQILQGLLQTAPHAIGETQGRAGRFEWRVTTQPSQSDVRWPNAQICLRSAQVRAIGTGRLYGLSTAEICPVPRSL